MKLISICIPVFNEEENILIAKDSIDHLFKNELKNYNYEIIFTDNNSSDKTEQIITELTKKNTSIKYIRFKNNLGYDRSLLEGYKNSKGEATVVIDCDLQDPVIVIKNFVLEWEKGHDLVYGIRKKRNENYFFTFLRKIYYRIMKSNSNTNYPVDAGDFRLVDKNVIKKFENNISLYPYMRGLTFSLSQNPKGIEYERNKRKFGKSKLGYYNTFTYAINALFEETRIFVRLFGRLSLFGLLVTLIFSLINIFSGFLLLSVYKNIVLGILVFIVFVLSIISEYVLRIYFQLKSENKIVYQKRINI